MSLAALKTKPSKVTPSRISLALLLLGATVLFGWAAAARLESLASQVSVVPADDPYVALDREITAEFGMENPVIWVIEARHGTVWTREMLERISAITRDVMTIPGVIATDVVSLASPNLRDLKLSDAGFEPVYLMGQIPSTSADIAALRDRVERDPNYRGTLVSLDGSAAMIVANFDLESSDTGSIGRAALELAERYRRDETAVYVAGAPVLAQAASAAIKQRAWLAALALAGCGILFGLALGIRTTLLALASSTLALTWSTGALIIAHAMVLPWVAFSLPLLALIALVVVVASSGLDAPSVRRRDWIGLGLSLVAGFAILAMVAGSPAAGFGVAGGVGAVSAILAGAALARLAPRWTTTQGQGPTWSRGLAIVILLALAGLTRLEASFGLIDYGQRYLPGPGAADLRAIGRLFPPPASLAIRLRGEPGFVANPEVLSALDALGRAVATDPVVRGGTRSLADIVKLVNRAFNDDRPELERIPEERGLAARYLMLAYSPGFRRFVDRALSRAAFWVQLDSHRPADVARVLSRIESQLAAEPVPGAEVDLVGGDGAMLLVMARVAWKLALGGLALLLATSLGLGVWCGWNASLRWLASGLAAAGVAAGCCGWAGVPIDLVSLPCLIVAAVAGALLGWRGPAAAALPLAAMAVPALLVPYGLANLAGAALLGPAVAAALPLPEARLARGKLQVPELIPEPAHSTRS